MDGPIAHQSPEPPVFDAAFRGRLAELIAWRRDVRRFRTDPVDDAVVGELIAQACHAPSVGNSQPWRFISVERPDLREGIRAAFEAANADALRTFEGEQATLYAQLKLAGLREAPVHLAVFCDEATEAGHGLGRRTMPETLRYSTVLAVHTLWLTARARGLGVGWVSIIDPRRVAELLGTPPGWAFVAYLCLGHPVEEHIDPELVRHHWQDRLPPQAVFSRL